MWIDMPRILFLTIHCCMWNTYAVISFSIQLCFFFFFSTLYLHIYIYTQHVEQKCKVQIGGSIRKAIKSSSYGFSRRLNSFRCDCECLYLFSLTQLDESFHTTLNKYIYSWTKFNNNNKHYCPNIIYFLFNALDVVWRPAQLICKWNGN